MEKGVQDVKLKIEHFMEGEDRRLDVDATTSGFHFMPDFPRSYFVLSAALSPYIR